MINIFKNKSDLSYAFCVELLQTSLKKEKISLALSGGSTPKIIFQTFVKDFKEKIDWKKIHLFWGDERCVPPEDEESNFGMTKKYLLNLINIPQKNIHRIRGENNPAEETEKYSNEIKKHVPFVNDLPLFDIITLGLGEDGHTASIFPDQMKLLTSEKICEVAVHPKSGQKRITLTGKVINNAEQVIFLITGGKKANIIKEVVESGEKDKYPAAHINPVNGKLYFFIDKDAAKLLT